MKTIKINGEDYTLEYTFEAAMESDVVQMEFDILTGSALAKEAETSGGNEITAMLGAMSKSISTIPSFVSKAFYAGLKAHHDVDKSDSDKLLRAYMKENKLSFPKVNEMIQTCMVDDDFFEVSGLMEMIGMLTESVEEAVDEIEKEQKPKTPKTPQDHKKPQTKTKASVTK